MMPRVLARTAIKKDLTFVEVYKITKEQVLRGMIWSSTLNMSSVRSPLGIFF